MYCVSQKNCPILYVKELVAWGTFFDSHSTALGNTVQALDNLCKTVHKTPKCRVTLLRNLELFGLLFLVQVAYVYNIYQWKILI